MKLPSPSQPNPPPSLLQVRRKAVAVTPTQLVHTQPLIAGQAIPTLVTPVVPEVDVVDWTAAHPTLVDQLLLTHKALLFRGFHRQRVEQFSAFARQTAHGASLEYRDRTTPRVHLGDGIYTSTVYPADRRIQLHNEGTYWTQWPLKLYFACAVASTDGGETPLANVAHVLQRLRPRTRARFAATGVMLVRNYNDGFGLPWQDVFQTRDRTAVEAYCRAHDISWEWRDGERLRTRQVRPAIRQHPRTGEAVWFNHAAFFHHSTYPTDLRTALLTELGAENLPYNTYYGDGAEIKAAVTAEIHEAYNAERVQFPWQPGDILLLDNMTIAHGREPFTGERQVLVSMNELYGEREA